MLIDIIEGKGNGLIMFLYGGFGIGKMLIVESVVEIVWWLFFFVICGDIGIELVSVERYLELVFYLGKMWGCVVLLDEVDVFFE